jgi:nitrate/TMAO reductase-like tetraheme cytochrome c subunit
MLFCIGVFCLAVTPGMAQENPMDVEGMHRKAYEFPTAEACGTCHPNHFREWSTSPHAYAQLSPVFNAMQATITTLTNGTNADFCIRCHTQTGMAMGESTFMTNMDRDPTSRQGISCAVCHRINEVHGKVSSRFSVESGDIYTPVYGPRGGEELKRVQADPDFKVATPTDKELRSPIHLEAQQFSAITTSGFCGSCHDVTLLDGFRLEEAFSEYKSSPAAKQGVTCQDCHMGKTGGVFTGDPKTNYDYGPAAVVNGKATRDRKLTNHMFAGPDHSIIHPGLFPHNPRAARLATMREWLTFDYRAGWGTEAFEDTVAAGYVFPERWATYDDRVEAREIIDGQIALLDTYMAKRTEVLSNGYQIGDIVTRQADDRGIRFKVQLRNATTGHNVPTGFTAERLVYIQVTVTDSEGKVVFQSGDLDPNGDVRDNHSIYVHNGDLPKDPYLLSLQSKFITRNIRGGDREQVLAVNYSIDPLPFLRPSTFSAVLTGRPAGARIHKQGIEPNGSRWQEYEVKKSALTGKGPYRATVKLFAAMVPVNLVNAVKDVGFDYGMSAREIGDGIVARHALLGESEAVIDTRQGADKVVWTRKAAAPTRWHRPSAAHQPETGQPVGKGN